MNGSLTKAAVRGMTWSGISQAVGQGLRLVATIILARLLLPEDFGIIAMTLIVTTLVMRIGDLGFSSALIQRKDVTDSHLSTTFWTALALGFIFCLVTVAISPLMANFFDNEDVGPVLAVSALSFVIMPLGGIHATLLMKRLDFFKFSVVEIAEAIIYVAMAVPLAFAGFGVWSIVWGNLASQVARALLRWVVCPWHPSMTFSFQSLRDLWRFGFNVTGDRSVHFLTERLDYLIIGKFLAPAALGFYNLGYRIVEFPTSSLWMAVNRVAFSTFSLVQDEHERLRRGFTKSLTYLSLIVFPLFVGLAIVAPELVKVVFGQKWAAAVSPVQILCIMAAITSISVAVGAVLRSKGRPDIELKLSLVKLALLVMGLLIGVRFGTVGAAAGVSAVAAIIWLPRQMFANRLIGLRMRDYFASLRPAAFGSVVMALTLLAFRYAVGSLLSLPDVELLIGSVLLGAVTYFMTLKVDRTQALGEMIQIALDMVRPYARLVMERLGLRRKEAPRFAETAHGEDL